MAETLTKLVYYESEYEKLKESTTLLELALWKMNVDASSTDSGVAMEVDNRLQCRISCGAEYVIENVLPSISNLSILCVLTSTSHDTMRRTVTAATVMMMMTS